MVLNPLSKIKNYVHGVVFLSVIGFRYFVGEGVCSSFGARALYSAYY